MIKVPAVAKILTVFSLASFCLLSFTGKPVPGEEIITAMHKKWNGRWYENFAFEQKAIFFKDKKVVKEEVWQEILTSPGKLHIRFNGFETGNGAIYNNDSVYQYKSGVLQGKRRETNFLALLGFDVYFYKPQETLNRLKEMGFDLTKSYKTSFKNTPVIVVGTNDPSDLTSSQFWVDTKRFLVLRAVKNTAGQVRDVHFNNYQQIEKNWVATEMVFTNGTDTVFVEEYFNMKFPKKVANSTYDPARFKEAKW
ncbi:MAG TPA: hypothetical protein VGD90_13340 [Sphingobacteriaceae bacterium]